MTPEQARRLCRALSWFTLGIAALAVVGYALVPEVRPSFQWSGVIWLTCGAIFSLVITRRPG